MNSSLYCSNTSSCITLSLVSSSIFILSTAFLINKDFEVPKLSQAKLKYARVSVIDHLIFESRGGAICNELKVCWLCSVLRFTSSWVRVIRFAMEICAKMWWLRCCKGNCTNYPWFHTLKNLRFGDASLLLGQFLSFAFCHNVRKRRVFSPH